MNEETKLILKSLEYLLWVHQPRSEKSEEMRDQLQIDIHLLLNPIIPPSLEEKTKDALREKLMEKCTKCGSSIMTINTSTGHEYWSRCEECEERFEATKEDWNPELKDVKRGGGD